MGWMFTTRRVPAGSESEYLINETGCLRWSTMPEEERPRVIAHCKKGRACFFAVRVPAAYFDADASRADSIPHRRGADGSITQAVIVLTDRSGGGFGWKDMSECSSPYEFAPASFLKHLSALNPDHPDAAGALAWRAGCAAASAKASADRRTNAASAARVQEGDVVTFPEGTWVAVGSARVREFRAVWKKYRHGRRIAEGIVFEPVGASGIVCLSGKVLAGATVTRPTPAAA